MWKLIILRLLQEMVEVFNKGSKVIKEELRQLLDTRDREGNVDEDWDVTTIKEVTAITFPTRVIRIGSSIDAGVETIVPEITVGTLIQKMMIMSMQQRIFREICSKEEIVINNSWEAIITDNRMDISQAYRNNKEHQGIHLRFHLV